MMRVGKDELICDFAETYNIYDIHQVRPSTLATLAVGLRENSRIKMKLAGQKIDLHTQIMASILDRLSILVWQNTEDGRKGRHKPTLILEELTRDHSKDAIGFSSIEDFEQARRRIMDS